MPPTLTLPDTITAPRSEAASPAKARTGLQASTGPTRRRDRLHLFPEGFLYTSDGVDTESNRFSVTIYLALGDGEFEIEADGRRRRVSAVAVRPFVTKRLLAVDTPFASIDLRPNHPAYRAFVGIPGDGVLALPRERFELLRLDMTRVHTGEAGREESAALFDRAAALAAEQMPELPPLDPRLQKVMELLEANADCSAEELATAVCLSQDRLSHLFTGQFGISLRQYRQSLKIFAAVNPRNGETNLTEIAASAGFADSAHFCKVWVRAFGASPAYFYCSGMVTVDALPDGTAARARNCG